MSRRTVAVTRQATRPVGERCGAAASHDPDDDGRCAHCGAALEPGVLLDGKALRVAGHALRVAAATFADDATMLRREGVPGYERLALAFDDQAAAALDLARRLDEADEVTL